MPGHDIIVVGASAGGVEALKELVAHLPPDLPAVVFVVVHVPAYHTSAMPNILTRASPLEAVHPQDGETIQPGCIYVAPPDQHLLINNGHIHLSRGPRENGHRPAIDPLFRSAANAYGPRVVGVILSGMLDDGSLGLATVKGRGGVAIVQDPADALYSDMPNNAIRNVPVDYILPLHEIGPLLARLAAEEAAREEGEVLMENKPEATEAEIVRNDKALLERNGRPGEPTVLTCPDCGGVLWELHNGNLLRYRCHVGHAYSAESLMLEQANTLEAALWTAVRALEEKASLARRMAARANKHATRLMAARFEAQALDAEQRAALVRQVLLGNEVLAIETSDRSDSPPVEPAVDGPEKNS